MEIPTVPTDRLDKFVFIAGLWVVLISFFGPRYLAFLYEEKKYSLDTDARIHKLEIGNANAKINDLRRKIKSATENIENISLEKAVKSQMEFENESKNIEEIFKESEIKDAKLFGLSEQMKYYDREIKFLEKSSWFGLVIGVLMSVYGFWHWRKVENIYDASLAFTKDANKSSHSAN